MLFEFFVMSGGGNLWFWLLVLAEIGLISFTPAKNQLPAGFWGVILFIAIMMFLGDFNFLSYAYHNPAATCVYAITYAAIGGIWSIFSWLKFLQECDIRYLELKQNFINDRDITTAMSGDQKTDWLKLLNSNSSTVFDQPWYPTIHKVDDIVPKPIIYKERFTFWIIYWPFSVIRFCLSDVVDWVYRAIYNRLHGIYCRMSNRIFRKHTGDFL